MKLQRHCLDTAHWTTLSIFKMVTKKRLPEKVLLAAGVLPPTKT